MRLLVIGGDAAGMTAASEVNRSGSVDVSVIERGDHTSYSMCGIPYYVGGQIEEADDLVVRTPEEFREQGITVHMRTEALAIDPGARTVRVRDLDTGIQRDEPYDGVLVATGAHPVTPPVDGLEEYGHVVHTLDEGEALRAHLDQRARSAQEPDVRRAVVVGGGYIGIEVAEALVRRGIDAVLIDRAPQVMLTLDEDMAAHVEEALRGFGIDVRVGEDLVAVRGAGGRVTEVETSQGTYPADVVILAAGSRPNAQIAADAGCEVGESGAIVVDERMRTSLDGIWAAGDVVESLDLVAGRRMNVQLGTHANKQGKVAAFDIMAALTDGGVGDAAFPGVVGTAVTQVCEWEIGRTGLTEREAHEAGLDFASVSFTSTARAGYMPDAGVVYVKMTAERGTGRVLGCQLVGTGNVAKRIDVAATWCQLGVTVQQAQFLDLSYAPPFGGVWDLLLVAARKLTVELDLSPQL